ncbi:MarR family winged helix-turn-helix transcriptional regulator [Mycobacterium sp. 141]|uniref:MarR family winged helix-turn-helix transcriptional regulator n=1 Tax=Mycobacterium sp. 141 TaxID=1120797 RepID=UPI0003668C70|nr:MarR family transcriptional regulator [Mycobacterium sp. 141]
MVEPPTPEHVAAALFGGIALITRRVRQLQAPGDLTLPERAALERLDRGGPTSAADLARIEQISPQAMGVTLGALQSRGFVRRTPDPRDARRQIMSLTAQGSEILQHKRDARVRHFAQILTEQFSADELQTLAAAIPLLERLGEHI